MPAPFNIPVEEPTLSDVLNAVKQDIFRSLNCHALATVQSFDSESQTVTATIDYCKTFYEKDRQGQYVPRYVNYPTLIDVPVISLCGGGGALTFPIAQGDKALILFNDRDISDWFAGQTPGGPNPTARMHSLADGIALVGLNDLSDYDGSRVALKKGETIIALSNKIELANATKNLKTILDNITNAAKAIAQAAALITVTCPPGGGVSSVPINAASFTTQATALTNAISDLGALLE